MEAIVQKSSKHLVVNRTVGYQGNIYPVSPPVTLQLDYCRICLGNENTIKPCLFTVIADTLVAIREAN